MTDLLYKSMRPRKRECAICGGERRLTQHHVVPLCYRQWMPERYGHKRLKKQNCADIVFLCQICHMEYEKSANRLKDRLGFVLGTGRQGKAVVKAIRKSGKEAKFVDLWHRHFLRFGNPGRVSFSYSPSKWYEEGLMDNPSRHLKPSRKRRRPWMR